MIKIAGRLILVLIILFAVLGGGWEWASAIHFQSGRDYYHEKNYYRAREEFEAAAKYSRLNPEPHRWLAKSYGHLIEGRQAQGQIELLRMAEKELLKAVAIEPHYPYYWYELGRVSELMEQLAAVPQKSALFCYHQAAFIDPNNPIFLQSLADYLIRHNKTEQAKSYITRLITFDQGTALEVAVVWVNQGNSPEELIDCFAVNEAALINLAQALINPNYLKVAQIAAQKAYNLAPHNLRAVLVYGMVNSASGDCERAREIMRPVFSSPEYALNAKSSYAQCLFYKNDYEKDEEAYLELIRLRPDVVDYRAALASLYLAQNKTGEAKEQLIWLASQTESADEEKGKIYLSLAGIFEKENNPEEALKYYKLYLTISPADKAVGEKVEKLENFKPGDIIYSPWEIKNDKKP